MFCYSNNGASMRAVDPAYAAQSGEVLFSDYPTGVQLAAAFPSYAPPAPPRPTVQKSIVQARIIAAGKMPAAYSALTANPVFFARWFAPDRQAVFSDDPDAMSFVTALGLDPTVILAP